MHPKDRPEAHQIVWDEPSLEHSTWQGPPAFDFSPVQHVEAHDAAGGVLHEYAPAAPNWPDFSNASHDSYEPSQQDHEFVQNHEPENPYAESDAQADAIPASYAEAPAQGRSGISTQAEAPAQGRSGISTQAVTSQSENAPVQHDHAEGFPEDSLTIGRSRSNGIVLDDMLVSRRHVVITADDEGLLLRDLDSRNGTFVNGRKVEQTHLHEGDRIGIGASTFEVRNGWLVAV